MCVRINRLFAVSAVLVLASIIAGANIGQFLTIQQVQKLGAQHLALDEAKNILVMVPDIGELVQTGQPDDAQATAMTAVTRHGDISAILLFDRTGQNSLVRSLSSWTSDPSLNSTQNQSVGQVLASGEPTMFAEHTYGSTTLPHLYGSAFVPIFGEAGVVEGVVGIYLDQSEMADKSDREFFKLSIFLSVVFTIVMILLLAGYLLMHGRAKSSRQQLDHMARYDQLTGLHNRGGFYSQLRKLHSSGNLPPERTAVLYFDLDNFKSINDAHGHRAGDDILRHVGDAVRAGLGPNDLAGRFGGDEFIVIAETGTLGQAVKYAERMQALVAQPLQANGMTLHSSASFGIHFGVGVDTSVDEDIHRADLALYQAKLDGRNVCRVFTPELEAGVNRRRKVENAVNRGLEDGLFHLQFQPLIHHQTEKCVGFEALLRLTDGDGEHIAPMEFIPIAETSGAIRAIGNWVLRMAVAEALTWPEDLFVSVNLSARQFDDEDLVATVRSTLDDVGLDPTRLELEVTESLLIENTDSVGMQLAELRALGVSIAMDDFGTGYSSLGYLWKYGFDKIKIDRSFILGLEADLDRAREILGTIIVLGHRLNMSVTAEGIETETQARLLSDLSCDLFQGFLYGRPMSSADLSVFLIGNHTQALLEGAGMRKLGSRKTG